MEKAPSPEVKLNLKECKVAALLLQGCQNKDIGQELNLSTRTIKAYMNRMFNKFGLTDSSKVKRVQLALVLYREEVKRGR